MENIPAPLKGKVALVTGGSRGIGKAVAQTFARHGCTHIAITYKGNKAAADATLSSIAAINPSIKAIAFAADVGDPDCGSQAVKQTLAGLNIDHLDIMVSNATVLDFDAFGKIESLTKQQWDYMMTATAWTPFELARESSKVMPRGGRIIMISTIATKMANGDPVATYAICKSAMEATVRELAPVYGVEKGITVNSISVGATDTDTLANAAEGYGDGFLQHAANSALLKRIGTPQDVAEIVAFVASPQAGWIHGNQIPANGGAVV